MESISIESAEASFHQWRVQRSSRREFIPEHLWNMALGLYPQYMRSKICRRLGLSGGQFKQRLDGFRPALIDTGFVLASNDEHKVAPKVHSEVQLLIQGKGGCVIADITSYWCVTMIHITTQHQLHIRVEPIDFRKGIDALVGLCRQSIGSPYNGTVFAFRNKSGIAVKAKRCHGTNNGGWHFVLRRLY